MLTGCGTHLLHLSHLEVSSTGLLSLFFRYLYLSHERTEPSPSLLPAFLVPQEKSHLTGSSKVPTLAGTLSPGLKA